MAIRLGTVIHDFGDRIAKRVPYSLPSLNGNTCSYCGVELTAKYTKTKDHVTNLVENKRIKQLSNVSNFTVPCCRTCNSKKGKKNVGYMFFTESQVINFYYDKRYLDSVCDEIETVLKKAQITADTISIFEDEQDYLFTEHIMSDDFVYLYDQDILDLENLRMKFFRILLNDQSP